MGAFDRPAETASTGTGGMSDKMTQFARAWVAQFGRAPADWKNRNDPTSSFQLFREFLDDSRTSVETCKIALASFGDEEPPFRKFRQAYFQTLRPDTGKETCSVCRGMRMLYAVTGDGVRKDGQRGTVITGPGHRAVPVQGAVVTTVRCRCHQADANDGHGAEFATSDRAIAVAHAEECEALHRSGRSAAPDVPREWV